MTRPATHPRRPRTRAALIAALVAGTALALTSCGTDTSDGTDASRDAETTSASPTTPPAADDGSTPDVPVDPAQLTEVPDDFPLAAGLPDTNDSDGSPVEVTDGPATKIKVCGEVVWSPLTPLATTDVASASYTGGEDFRSHRLALYGDELGAQQALDSMRDAYTGCPSETIGGTEQVYEVVEMDQGSATITHRYRMDGQFVPGLEVIELVAIGNAFYFSSYYGEGGGSDESIASSIDFAHDGSRPVWNAMALFAG